VEEIMRKFVSVLACGVLAFAMGCSKERAQNSSGGQQPSSNPSATDQSVTTNAQSAALNPDDRAFVEKAAAGGKAEVELGQLAQEKAQNEQVKQFAQRMVTDHSQANGELVSMGDKMQLTLPTELDKDSQDLKNKLSKLNGAKFDKEYMKAMVDDHQKDMQEFEKAAGSAVNSDVKTFASKTSAVIRQHLDMAKSIESSLK
jgi:putative membrane protein